MYPMWPMRYIDQITPIKQENNPEPYFRYFSIYELTKPGDYIRLGFDNIPTQEVIDNLHRLCRYVLHPLREYIGSPLFVTRGYYNPMIDEHFGCRPNCDKNSQHILGQAVDLFSYRDPILDTKKIVDTAIYLDKQGLIEVDQIIYMKFANQSYMHISHSPNNNRHEHLFCDVHDVKKYRQYKPHSIGIRDEPHNKTDSKSEN